MREKLALVNSVSVPAASHTGDNGGALQIELINSLAQLSYQPLKAFKARITELTELP